jgi:3-oxoacyl-[acyl-carrier protein] reductase
MENILENKVVVITGAGGGIGRAIALKLAQFNTRLVLLGANNVQKLKETFDLVTKSTQAIMLPGNLTDMDFITQGIDEAVSRFGGIDILINNAGATQSAAFESVSEEDFDRIMAINIKAPFFITRKAIPFLKKSSAATIINIASVVSHAGYPLQSVYSASKHAMLGFTKSIAAEYYKDNIRVHAISPGGVYTDMVKISRPDLTAEGMISAAEVADAVCFLLSARGNAVIDEIVMHRVNKEPFLV